MSWRSSGLIEHLGIRICFSGASATAAMPEALEETLRVSAGMLEGLAVTVVVSAGTPARTATAAIPDWAPTATALTWEPLRTDMAPT